MHARVTVAAAILAGVGFASCRAAAQSAPTWQTDTRQSGDASPRSDEQLGPLFQRAQQAMQEQRWADAIAGFEELTKLRRDSAEFAFGLGLALHLSGDYERALAAHRRAAEFEEVRARALFNLACAQALLKRPQAALDSLEEAVDAGFADVQTLRSDADLESIREMPRFAEIVEFAERGPELPALTWENLPRRLDELAAEGFSGSVLVVRDGAVVIDTAYGFADREKGIPNRPDTIYCVGSTPIDFTKAGILLLREEGKLQLADTVGKYFGDAPADKRDITIEQLMTGASGLENFHDLPGDRDPDHTYIDRAEAMRRIFARPLLFEPGTDRRHSHSAWGVLCAIIEIVSGQTYEEFTQERLFEPARMRDTFNYGAPIEADRMALGYSDRTDGRINAPPYWGPSSWLVKGSGGMVSTTHDMNRWHTALFGGVILSKESLRLYGRSVGGYNEGGSQYGYLIHYTEGPRTRFYLTSNAKAGERAARRFSEQLAHLVWADFVPPFTLGISFDSQQAGPVEITVVVPGGAADRAGVQVGDRLRAIDGVPLGESPMDVVYEVLRSGTSLRCEFERGDEAMTLEIIPAPR